MQSLISPVDHESRTNSYHADNEPIPTESEETPLLHSYPRTHHRTNLITITIVSGMMVFLVLGIGIGIYLLVLQNNADNILPPIPNTYQLVTRSQWDPLIFNTTIPETFKAKHVIIKQTDTKQCWEMDECINLLKKMKSSYHNSSLPYNYLVSDDIVYESIGWKYSPVPELSALVVAFIGNFTNVPPTAEQINAAKNFISTAVSESNLDNNFTIIGKSSKEVPKYLFNSFMSSPKWNKELSDLINTHSLVSKLT